MKRNVLRNVRDVIVDQDCLWIITSTLNSLFKYDFAKNELELEAVFIKAMWADFDPFFKIVKIRNEIYFIPRMAKNFFYYNLDEKKFYELAVSFEGFQDSKNISVIEYKDIIYCLNRCPDVLIKINSHNKDIKILDFELYRFQDVNVERKIYSLYKEPCIYKEKIIWPSYNNILVIFDVKSESFSLKYVDSINFKKAGRWSKVFGEDINDFVIRIKAFDNVLLFITIEGRIYCYVAKRFLEIRDEIFDNYMHYNDVDGIMCPIIFDVMQLDDELLIIPSYKNRCVKFAIDTMECEGVLQEYLNKWNGNRRSYSFCKEINKHVFLLFSYYENYFYILDVMKDVVYRESIEFSYAKFAYKDKDFEQVIVKNGIYEFDELKFLLDTLVMNNIERKNEKKLRNIGKQIFSKFDWENKKA